jgi:hypothetical protein
MYCREEWKRRVNILQTVFVLYKAIEMNSREDGKTVNDILNYLPSSRLPDLVLLLALRALYAIK